ncbi:hypothetical protein BC828DRAFT_375946 [Blastocladiella britannica]|nr:hypothetical protein BC828DRAFT_375946 [Blastocladiella britannica]
MTRMLLLVQLAAALVLLAATTANAHFTLQSPVASREKTKYPSDNRRFFPIAGGNTLRPELDCLTLPKGPKARVQAGAQQVFGFEIGNFAKHVGPCTAFLINPATGTTTKIGDQADCVNKFEAMTVQMPSTTCTDCVVKIKVSATHISAANPEFYDSCMDVDVVGGSAGGNTGGNNGGGSKPKPRPTPTAAPPAPAPAPPAPTATTPGKSQNDGSAACTPGQMVCGAGGKTIRQCAFGKFVDMPVAPGTKCVPNGDSISIAYA